MVRKLKFLPMAVLALTVLISMNIFASEPKEDKECIDQFLSDKGVPDEVLAMFDDDTKELMHSGISKLEKDGDEIVFDSYDTIIYVMTDEGRFVEKNTLSSESIECAMENQIRLSLTSYRVTNNLSRWILYPQFERIGNINTKNNTFYCVLNDTDWSLETDPFLTTKNELGKIKYTIPSFLTFSGGGYKLQLNYTKGTMEMIYSPKNATSLERRAIVGFVQEPSDLLNESVSLRWRPVTFNSFNGLDV